MAPRRSFSISSTRAPHDSYAAAPRYVGRFKDEPIVHTADFNEPDMSDKPSWWRHLAPRKTPGHRQRAAQGVREPAGGRRRRQGDLRDAEAEGAAGQTVVVFMTDNSIAFGEHRWRGKGWSTRRASGRRCSCPIPGRQARKVTALVSNVDIAPTFADIAGRRQAAGRRAGASCRSSRGRRRPTGPTRSSSTSGTTRPRTPRRRSGRCARSGTSTSRPKPRASSSSTTCRTIPYEVQSVAGRPRTHRRRRACVSGSRRSRTPLRTAPSARDVDQRTGRPG